MASSAEWNVRNAVRFSCVAAGPSQSTPSANLSLNNRPPEVSAVAVDTSVLFEKKEAPKWFIPAGIEKSSGCKVPVSGTRRRFRVTPPSCVRSVHRSMRISENFVKKIFGADGGWRMISYQTCRVCKWPPFGCDQRLIGFGRPSNLPLSDRTDGKFPADIRTGTPHDPPEMAVDFFFQRIHFLKKFNQWLYLGNRLNAVHRWWNMTHFAGPLSRRLNWTWRHGHGGLLTRWVWLTLSAALIAMGVRFFVHVKSRPSSM